MYKLKNLNRWLLLVACFFYSSCQSTDVPSIGPKEECEARKMVEKFGETYATKRKMKVIVSVPFLTVEPRAVFGLWMADFSLENLETGRKLAVNFVENFWKYFQKKPYATKYFTYKCSTFPRLYFGELSLNHMMVRIAFWDKEINRPKAPYLAEILFFHNNFYYYQADPKTETLNLILKESYKESLRKVKNEP